jgi:hypothetical protein
VVYPQNALAPPWQKFVNITRSKALPQDFCQIILAIKHVAQSLRKVNFGRAISIWKMENHKQAGRLQRTSTRHSGRRVL